MNILPIEFRVLGGMWCGDVVALNASESFARDYVPDPRYECSTLIGSW
jgi:hypothetical protein